MTFRNFIRKLFRWEVPRALPMRRFTPTVEFTWEDWEARMRSQYPIRYFLCETVPRYFGYKWHCLDQWLYWLKSVTYKKRHLLDLRQPKDSPLAHSYRYGWCDIVNRMPYAMFNMLIDYVEKELGGPEETQKFIDELKSREGPPHQIHTMEEALRIYKWWKVDRIAKLKAQDDIYTEWYLKIHSSEGKVLFDKMHEEEEAFENELDDMLKAMVDIRRGLWT